MLQNSYYNEKVVLKNMQLPSYAVSTQSSQGKVKSMKTKSAVPEKTIKVPSTSIYKDNKIYKCPVCKGSLISEDIFYMWSYPQTIEKNLLFFLFEIAIKYTYTNISSVVELQRWWVLKSKIFGQEPSINIQSCTVNVLSAESTYKCLRTKSQDN